MKKVEIYFEMAERERKLRHRRNERKRKVCKFLAELVKVKTRAKTRDPSFRKEINHTKTAVLSQRIILYRKRNEIMFSSQRGEREKEKEKERHSERQRGEEREDVKEREREKRKKERKKIEKEIESGTLRIRNFRISTFFFAAFLNILHLIKDKYAFPTFVRLE